MNTNPHRHEEAIRILIQANALLSATLDDETRDTLGRLAIFEGGCDRAAASAILARRLLLGPPDSEATKWIFRRAFSSLEAERLD